MTDERKNEIWAMLSQTEKDEIKYELNALSTNVLYNKGYADALKYIFGRHNLTTQTEQNASSISANTKNCENPTNNGVSDENVLNLAASSVDYAQYRLDLAKDIAVAMISNLGNLKLSNLISLSTIAEDSVRIANEIVKRLKET